MGRAKLGLSNYQSMVSFIPFYEKAISMIHKWICNIILDISADQMHRCCSNFQLTNSYHIGKGERKESGERERN